MDTPIESSNDIQDSISVLKLRAEEFRSAANELDNIARSLAQGYEKTYTRSASMYLRRAAVSLEACMTSMSKLESMQNRQIDNHDRSDK